MASGTEAAGSGSAKRRKITKQVKYAFLHKFEEGGNQERAARFVGVSLSALRQHANPNSPVYDPAFADAWAHARDFDGHVLVDERLLMVIGYDWEPVFEAGALKLLVTRFSRGASDQVLIEQQDDTVVIQHRIDMNILTRLERQLLSQGYEDAEEEMLAEVGESDIGWIRERAERGAAPSTQHLARGEMMN